MDVMSMMDFSFFALKRLFSESPYDKEPFAVVFFDFSFVILNMQKDI